VDTGGVSAGVKRPWREPAVYFHRVPRVRMCGTMPPLASVYSRDGYLSIQIHTQSMQYLLHFHCNNVNVVINYVISNFYRARNLHVSSGSRQFGEFHCGRNVALLVVKFSLLYEDPDIVFLYFFLPIHSPPVNFFFSSSRQAIVLFYVRVS
jgi:hypothetical protein